MDVIVLVLSALTLFIIKRFVFESKTKQRGEFYNNVYLKSDDWKRKRYIVLKRDNWRCVDCGNKATEVHHEKYANDIGKEPIEWLVSICKTCHRRRHDKS
jgi:hypothetical protein